MEGHTKTELISLVIFGVLNFKSNETFLHPVLFQTWLTFQSVALVSVEDLEGLTMNDN